jgi:putative transposase
MSILIHKSHNVTALIYHLVCPAKYRRVVMTEPVDQIIKETCIQIGLRYDMHFLEIGTDKDHVHFLIQSVPMMRPQQIVQTIKSITAKQVFQKAPDVKIQLWGGQFWSAGYFMNTVGKAHTESAVAEYVRGQGREKEYVKIHSDQLKLF